MGMHARKGRSHDCRAARLDPLERRRLLAIAMVGETYFSDAPTTSGVVHTSITVNGLTYFGVWTASSSTYLQNPPELWRTDGTPGGTAKVATLEFPSAVPSNSTAISNFANLNGTIFFTENLDPTDLQLWKSDGTAAGTQEVMQLTEPLTSSSTPESAYQLTAFNGRLYFENYNNSTASWNLWSTTSTGTPQAITSTSVFANSMIPFNNALYLVGTGLWKVSGTTLTQVANLGVDGTVPPVILNNRLYFATPNSTTPLYSSDGTTSGTVAVSGAAGTSATMAVSGGKLYRVGTHASGTNDGFELWATDGSTGGLYEVADIRAGSGSSIPLGFTDIGGGKIVFSADDGVHGRELYVSDSTAGGTFLVKDINAGSAASSPSGFVAFDGKVYFTADDGIHGQELWVSDGTAAGTQLVRDIYPGPATSSQQLLNADNGLFFGAVDPSAGNTLYHIAAGSTDPVALQDLNAGALNKSVANGTGSNGAYYFQGGDATSTGSEFYLANSGGTSLLHDFNMGAGSSTISGIMAFGSKVIFGETVSGSIGLWSTDGTAAGTKPFFSGTSIGAEVVFNGRLYFYAVTSSSSGIFSSDGTLSGNKVVFSGAVMKSPVVNNGYIYYTDGSKGFWRTDGTTRTEIKTFTSSASTPAVSNLASIGNLIYMSAADGGSNNGMEPWKSDGTTAGTVMIKNIIDDYTIPFGSNPSNFVSVGGWILFAGYNTGLTRDLYRTDGTAAGTQRIIDLPGAPNFGSIGASISAFGKLIFSAGNSTTGLELWITDGTTAGTMMLKDILPGSVSSSPQNFVQVGNYVYFTAQDPTYGRELWATDGTAAGTFRVTDLNPGAASSNPLNLAASGNTLYFTANDGTSVKVFRVSVPTAQTGGTYLLSPGWDVQLNGSASGINPSDTYSYAWDLDGDGIFGEMGANASNGDEVGANPVFNADNLIAGNYPVSLRVTDSTGLVGSQTAVVNVGSLAGVTLGAGGHFTLVGPANSGLLSIGATASLTADQNGESIAFGSDADVSVGAAQHVQAISLQDGARVTLGTSVSITMAGGDIGAWNGSAYDGLSGAIQGGAIAPANGQSVGVANLNGSIVIRSTAVGDANLDGKVNADDYFQIDSHYETASDSAKSWFTGDFNYDGKINGDDYFLIDSGFASQIGQQTAALVMGAVKPSSDSSRAADGSDEVSRASVGNGSALDIESAYRRLMGEDGALV